MFPRLIQLHPFIHNILPLPNNTNKNKWIQQNRGLSQNRCKFFTKPLIYIDSNFIKTFCQTLRLAYFHKGYQFLNHSFNHYTNKNMSERERERENITKRQSTKSSEFVKQNWILNNIALQIDHPTIVPSSSFNLNQNQ